MGKISKEISMTQDDPSKIKPGLDVLVSRYPRLSNSTLHPYHLINAWLCMIFKAHSPMPAC